MKKRLFILFPGGFKPVHAGHIFLAENAYKTMSEEYEPEIYFIVSSKEREALSMEPTIEFLERICRPEEAPYMHTIVPADCPSPIRYAYILAQTKAFGDGCYCLLSSTKGSDIKRARDFFNAFDTHGKYHTEGVEPVLMENVSIPLEFTSRTDEFQNTPISASVLRMDVNNNDYESFFDGYRLLVECRWVDDDDVKEYFNKLKAHTGVSVEESICIQHLNEGGLGGHISHPYEVDDMTFNDMYELIRKLFCGEIDDVTEKVDGMNLFASVDLDGEPIFARNLGHIREMPYRLKDLSNPDLWRGGTAVSEAFRKGAEIIARVFQNMNNSTADFFNKTDTDGNLLERKWLNVEVIDPDNTNIIPYDKVMVMFHAVKLAVESPDGIIWDEQYDDSSDLEQLNSIAEKLGGDKAMKTPKVLLEKNGKGFEEAEKYTAELLELLDDYGLTGKSTIFDYKKAAISKYISTKFKELDPETLDAFAYRLSVWTSGSTANSYSMYWFKQRVDSETYVKMRDFEKTDFKQLKKKVIKPLETLFIKIGNRIISQSKNLVNSGSEGKIVSQIKKQITDIIDLTDKEGTEDQKDRLEQLLIKLDQTGNIVNSSEGLVFRYGGRLMKLTGSFAIINAMNMIKYNK